MGEKQSDSDSPQLKIFVWYEIMMLAHAYDVQEARKLITEKAIREGKFNDDFALALQKEPKIV